jgi:formylglycine-generating enzyme required for sulfatase activity
MKGRILAGCCLSLSFLGSLAAQAPPPAKVQAKDPPLVKGSTQAPSGLWETKVKIGPCTFEMVQVPPGSFQMGTDAKGIGWIEENVLRPVHSVTITRPFLMQKYPVTVAQFRAFVDATGYLTEQGYRTWVYVGEHNTGWEYKDKVNWRNPGFEHEFWDDKEQVWDYKDDLSRSDPSLVQEDTCPVVCVSWNDAQNFVQWLNTKGGKVTFRLPTEAEWEYACRAGTTGETYGSLDAIAWHKKNSSGHTHPVGQKQPNAFGLFDMLGNAWQWCQDAFATSIIGPSRDPRGPNWGDTRVERGGSWRNGDLTIRAAARDHDPTPDHRDDLGFRVVAVARTP